MNDGTAVKGAADSRKILGQPIGLTTLLAAEFWERFSYYGMRALLVLFLVDAMKQGGFGLDDVTANAIYGIYTAAVYLACLPGGWVADRLIGTQAAALWGGAIIATGHILLGLSGSAHSLFYFGLMVIVVGTGLLKPNLSALVAQLYPEGGARRDAGFTFYYMSINAGAFVAPFVTGWCAQQYGWHYGFFAAAVGMILGLVCFLLTRKWLGSAGRAPAPPPAGKLPLKASKYLVGMGSVVALVVALFWSGTVNVSATAIRDASRNIIAVVAAGYFVYLFFFAGLNSLERKRAVMMLVLLAACTVFFSGFEQAGSSFSLFAERYTDRTIGAFTFPAAWFQSVNPLFILIFGPVFSALWVILGARNLDPSYPLKFVFGLLGMAIGFLILAAAARLVAAGNLVSSGWLTSVYLFHTFGELCLSPVGLSAFTGLAPVRLVGQSLGVWFMGISLGQLLASKIAGEFDANNLAAVPGQMTGLFWYGMIAAAILLVVGWLVQRWINAAEKEQSHGS